jgi:mono/diheme cytochrome c family protein
MFDKTGDLNIKSIFFLRPSIHSCREDIILNLFLSVTSIVFFILLSIEARAESFQTATPKALARGEAVFRENCTACHGIRGDGAGPAAKMMTQKPRNFILGNFQYGNTPKQLFKTVTSGIEGTPMPSWAGLPENDRWAVIHYIKTLKKP